jgi:hypothetical protein
MTRWRLVRERIGAAPYYYRNVKMACHVLNDGRRVIAQREMVRVLAPGVDSGGLQRYVDNLPSEIAHLDLVQNFVKFRVPDLRLRPWNRANRACCMRKTVRAKSTRPII